MKKALSLAIVSVLASAFALSACAPSPNPADAELPRTNGERTEKPDSFIEIDIDGVRDIIDEGMTKLPLPGTRRIKHLSPYGNYVIEYVHTSPYAERDETLDYSLDLRNDNTYSLTVTAKGVTASHYGNWYMTHNGAITLFYDEPMEQEPHNVYISDSLYCELIPHGKIMIYDNANVIVLAKTDAAER